MFELLIISARWYIICRFILYGRYYWGSLDLVDGLANSLVRPFSVIVEGRIIANAVSSRYT